MRSFTGLSLTDIAFEVCTVFDCVKVLAVLVGGSAATFYAPEAYETRDLDFVLHLELFGTPKQSILTELGYSPSNAAGTYRHNETVFTLEILKGPLAIGEEVLRTWDSHRRGDQVLHVISATDSVKDRLASAIHFKDSNAIRQAAAVAKQNTLDLDAVRAWCEKEGGLKTFAIFKEFLKPQPKGD